MSRQGKEKYSKLKSIYIWKEQYTKLKTKIFLASKAFGQHESGSIFSAVMDLEMRKILVKCYVVERVL